MVGERANSLFIMLAFIVEKKERETEKKAIRQKNKMVRDFHVAIEVAG